MADTDALTIALRAAVQAAPDQPAIRLQLVRALLDGGEAEEALLHARAILQAAPDDAAALEAAAEAAAAAGQEETARSYRRLSTAVRAPADAPPLAEPAWMPVPEDPGTAGNDLVDPRPGVRLADVGGMEEVKRRLELSFLAPLRDPELGAYYGGEARGGLMLYGPPGCGKTYLARALAGELDAGFQAIGISDVLDMHVGESERRLNEAFEQARASRPCVVFLDEIDALGHKRSQLRNAGGRTLVNQLLTELDGVGADNEGVFVLAATNHPWDVDSALKRPGRFDRTLLVLPPDPAARRTILANRLAGRPVEGIDLDRLVARTELYSGADLRLLVDGAGESALEDALRTGERRPIGMADFDRAAKDVVPSTRPWFGVAYNYAAFAAHGGQFDELLEYIRRHRLA